MITYPDKAQVVEVLAETAKHAAMDSAAEHPEDLATAMICAIEHAAVALWIAHQRGADSTH